MKHFLLLLTLAISFLAYSQNDTPADSLPFKDLKEVIVKAYEQNSQLKNVPAAVNYIGQSQLNRFNNTSLVTAVNNTPGVRMEERSPGSYRLNIRGSTLRSPFGVRNVKIYYNQIPLTDPGGQSYLNQLGFYNVQSLEILKGPGSSLYGAGTGGVVLLESFPTVVRPSVKVDYVAGSYGLHNTNVNLQTGGASANIINYQHQVSDGYRDHTRLRRDILTWDASFKTNEKNQLTAHFLYGDLYYQTPGGLNANEYAANPRAARPRAGIFPGAAEIRAAIYQKTFLAGATYDQHFNDAWKNTTTFYGTFTQVKNPTIRNYERRTEPHVGGRTNFQYLRRWQETSLTFNLGAEVQKGFSAVKVYSNKQGNPDTLQTDDEIDNSYVFGFGQLSLKVRKWVITGGASVNTLRVQFASLSRMPVAMFERTYKNEFAPRFAVLRKINNDVSVYAVIAKGFSPPTNGELLPSNNIINSQLNAEHGWNYEAGLRGGYFRNKLYFDVNVFVFRLNNTIVTRRDSSGADFFANAGSTKQDGIESYLEYNIIDREVLFVQKLKAWTSHTWHQFSYNDFKQLAVVGGVPVLVDHSGRDLPSIPKHTLAMGIEMVTQPGLYLTANHYYAGRIPLNDANTSYGDSYHLLGIRTGFKKEISKPISIHIFAGIDNLLDETYSLGNDINAVNGRFYNAAPGRNYYGGISIKYTFHP